PPGKSEQVWVGDVGTAILRAAHPTSKGARVDRYALKTVNGARRDLTIEMSWRNTSTNKPYHRTVVAEVDTSDPGKWRLTRADVRSGGSSTSTSPRARQAIADAIDQLNR